MSQYLIDHAISEVLQQAPFPEAAHTLKGVVEIAEEMGLPVSHHNRCQLGRFVKDSEVGHLAITEKRLVNGTLWEVHCYPDGEAVRHVVRSFFS